MDYRPLLSRQTQAFSSPALRQITIEVQKVHGVNLGQGVCQLPTPDYLVEAAYTASSSGANKYTHPRGILTLREALAAKLERDNRMGGLDPETEIMVTCGATGAFEAVCAALLNPGDEVVVFEPYYPYHIQALRRYGAHVTFIPLAGPDWSFDREELADALGRAPKFVLVNTPGNPTGKVFTEMELDEIASLMREKSLLVSDEIYEYMVFDGARHASPASMPSLKGRAITIGGYSKTFSITGWRIGYLVAPPAIAEALTAVLDAIYVCAPAPLQEAVAAGLNHFDTGFYRALNQKYQGKRDRFVAGLTAIGLEPSVPAGAYYMLCRYESFAPHMSSMDFVRMMISTSGVGAVPSDDFVRSPADAKWVRFCLALEDTILDDALARLGSLAPAMTAR
jgi:aminotransferase